MTAADTHGLRAQIRAFELWRYATPVGECWEWRGANRGRYGSVYVKGRQYSAHRAAAELLFGPIPRGMVVMHTCDNPLCIRDSHLRVGTQAENVADMWAKGRGRPSRSMLLRTQCPQGHPYDAENTYFNPNTGHRLCRACHHARAAGKNERKRALRAMNRGLGQKEA